MSALKEDHAEQSKTLFVRNLPFTTTSQALEDVFSDIGPLKSCFVVKDKDPDKCKGYGYVIFSMLDDAIQAKDMVKKVDGRNIFITFADRAKKKTRERKKRREGESGGEHGQSAGPPGYHGSDDVGEHEQSAGPHGHHGSNDDDNQDSTAPAKNDQGAIAEPAEQPSDTNLNNSKYGQAKTVVLTGLGTNPDKQAFKQATHNVKNIAKTIYPVNERSDSSALLVFRCVRDAKRAVRRLNDREFRDKKLHAFQLSKEVTQEKERKATLQEKGTTEKQSRLIVRNLSFKCTEADLRASFDKFGHIVDLVIPKKHDGRQQGFGFVQYVTVSEAEKAIHGMNMKLIKGRSVAVDWAVPKGAYIKAVGKDRPGNKSCIKEKIDDAVKETTNEGEESSSEEESQAHIEQGDNVSDSGDKEAPEEEEDEEEEEEDSESSEEDIDKKVKQRKPKPNDVNEGRTIFIRNLKYESIVEQLEELLEEFGEIGYCKLVVDPFTERSRGTAFIQFRSKEAVQSCLKKANEESVRGGLVLDGRRLSMSLAVTRQDAVKLTKDKKTKEKDDKRNLYLAREGLIRPGTAAAEGLSKADSMKRLKVEGLKRQKLKNPNIFVSSTRLCVRNIPVKTGDKELRKVFIKAVGDRRAKLKECRIMKDMSQVNSQGQAKSRGYAFVEFTEHEHALQALRHVNNNPDVFGANRRPIVEFSLENKTALDAKKKKLERIQMKQGMKEKKRTPGEKREQRTVVQQINTQGKGQTGTGEKGPKRPKVLPSHFGPKIRQRDKRKQTVSKQSKDRVSRKERQEQRGGKRKADREMMKEPKSKSKKQRREKTDDFDNLVNKYKNKILSKCKPGMKWFADS